MAEKELYLLQHGDTGKSGVYIGSTDVPLAPEGQQQVRETARSLRQKKIEKVFTSPMLRCLQTCGLLNLQLPQHQHALLKEVDFGAWEGKSFAQILASDASTVAAWTNDPAHFCFPRGEAVANFQERVMGMKKILTEEGQRRILVVSHGGVIRHLLCLFLGIPLEKYLVFDVQPGSYSSLLVYSEGAVLTGMNLRG